MRLSPRLLRQGRIPNIQLPPLPTVGELLRIYQIRASKHLSQNFLLDQNICRKFVKKSGPLTDAYVVEVGPGPGSLTRTILECNPQRLVLIEKDRRFIPILNDLKIAFESAASVNAADGSRLRRGSNARSPETPIEERVKVIRGDILNHRMEGLFPPEAVFPWDMDEDPPINVIGNLPFSISTPLLIKWLEDVSLRRGIFSYGRAGFTLTFQKEVADRMTADIMNVQRCRLSVMCQLYAHVRKSFIIPGRMFVPPPDVDVSVVTLFPKKLNDVPEVKFRMVEKLVRNVFQFRQKVISTCLERLFPPDICVILTKRMLDSTNIDRNTRPYYVSNKEIRLLCLAYKEICDEIPAIYHYHHADPGHLRMPIESEIYERYKEIYGEDLWRVGLDLRTGGGGGEVDADEEELSKEAS